MKKAFTLAEVLITLSILGIVAAISIPNLIQNYKEKSTVVKLKKVYSQLQNAFDVEEAINGPYDTWNSFLCSWDDVRLKNKGCTKADYSYVTLSNNGKMALIMRNLAQQKECSTDVSHPLAENDGCYITQDEGEVKTLAGSQYGDAYTWGKLYYSYMTNRYLLKDGTFIFYNQDNRIDIDINGKKGPNTMGKDIFQFTVSNRGFVPRGGGGTDYFRHDLSCKNAKSNGVGCARWVLERGNMDYLRKDTTW